jgi:hypothetical protein
MNRFFAEFLKSHCSKGIKATSFAATPASPSGKERPKSPIDMFAVKKSKTLPQKNQECEVSMSAIKASMTDIRPQERKPLCFAEMLRNAGNS